MNSPVISVLIILGTRPEAIKLAPVVVELRRRPDQFRVRLCSTGQHRQMLDQALDIFGLQPDIDLNLMQPDQTLASLTARALEAIDGLLLREQPDWVLAQGDTTTVLATALACFYRRIRFGHVEAGLRSGDLQAPWPEELNRRLATLAATLHFAPTAHARDALLAEGVATEAIHVTGNTVVDALRIIAERPFDWNATNLSALDPMRPLVLITAHRRESFGAPFRELCDALRTLAERFPTHQFLYPVHLNPNVRGPVMELLGGLPNLTLCAPVDYVTLVNLLKRAVLVLTDSGGIQEEAPTFGVPLLVLREVTERPEGVEAGFAQLVGTDGVKIVEEASRRLDRQTGAGQTLQGRINPYGDGQAAIRIADALATSQAQPRP